MAYDDAFFEQYAEYLLEWTVRWNHDRVFDIFRSMTGRRNVVDLGCGLGEFAKWGQYYSYCGVDLHPRLLVARAVTELKEDYLDLSFFSELPFMPDAFVSMFSVEPVLAPAKRNDYYKQLFWSCPELQIGLSAGFYYSSKRDQEQVQEAGGITSYQTIDEIEPNDVFNEMRITMRTPSKMFGPDVVEVFKILRRKS